MKLNVALLVLSSVLISLPAYADMSKEDAAADDAAAKKRHDAAAQEAARKAELERKNDALKAKFTGDSVRGMRKELGASAVGKSDDEVMRMYKEKGAQDTRNMQQLEASTRSERDSAMQNMAGKSLQDLENMSEEDTDRLTEELLKKYGQ